MKKKSRAARRKRNMHLKRDLHLDGHSTGSKNESTEFNIIQNLNEHKSTIELGDLVAYDEDLLERSRTQWQFGDWNSLIKLERAALQHHPDREKLALLAAAGHTQIGNLVEARKFTRLAQDWGCSKKLISQLLISGVHNTLGRVFVLSGQQSRALSYFDSAISIVVPKGEVRLLSRARSNEQLEQLGLHNNISLSSESLLSNKDCINSQELVLVAPTWLVKLVDECFVSDDVLEKIDNVTLQYQLSNEDLFFFNFLIAEQFQNLNDKLMAISFLNFARDYVDSVEEKFSHLLLKKFVELGKSDEAMDLVVQNSFSKLSDLNLSDLEKQLIEQAYSKVRDNQKSRTEHGHEVLLTYLKDNIFRLASSIKGRKPVLIEIGTTRENVPGQGSTRKIAEFCKLKNIHFITVDMDPHNTFVAANMFKKLNVSFEAINMKGEDFLRGYEGDFDFVFLDAYDFDHGGHSELRQSRYRKFLGASIDEIECHKMHLDCAKSVLKKLSSVGLVCVDDTWLEDGLWTAKGTLAMPYLLENGFNLLEARNRSALLNRVKEG